MKRRQALKSIAGISAAPLLAQELKENPAQPPPKPALPAIDEAPKLQTASADAVASGVVRFFSAEQFSALQKLSEILAPAINNTPGAKEAGAAEFLDFLLGQSPHDRQALYREGLDKLNAESRRGFSKPFAEIGAEQAAVILQPLREPWTYNGPSDPFARFLRAAKDDVLAATVNSREWIAAVSARSRGAGGIGSYWLPIE